MLINKLYSIESFEEGTESILARVLLNSDHFIFEGHFPGNPILPGVCTVQIVKELLEKSLKRKLMLHKAANIKYLGFVNPVTTPQVEFNLILKNTENGEIICNAGVSAAGNTVCSFKGTYQIK